MAAVRRAVLRLPEPESDPETDAEEFGPEMEAAYDTMVRRWLATAALLTTFAAIAASLVVTTYSKSSDNIATSDNNMTTTSTLTTTEIIRTITSTAASTTIGTGLLVVGGSYANMSAELWVPGVEGPCTLPDLPWAMDSPTVSWVRGSVLVCHSTTCHRLTHQGWVEGPALRETRTLHDATATARGLLVTGGADSPRTTELVTGDSSTYSFNLTSKWQKHCAIRISAQERLLCQIKVNSFFL